MTPGDPGCHCCINNVFHSIDLSSRNTPQVRKNPSGSPCPPRDTSHCTHFASLKCNLGREAKAPSLAPEGAGQAAKLCPPKMPLLSTGGRKLKNFPFPRNGITPGWDHSCSSAQNPLQLPCQTLGAASPHPSSLTECWIPAPHFQQLRDSHFQCLTIPHLSQQLRIANQ